MSLIELTCPNCNNMFLKREYVHEKNKTQGVDSSCSRPCAIALRNKRLAKPVPVVKCDNCPKHFEQKRKYYNKNELKKWKTYCSVECRKEDATRGSRLDKFSPFRSHLQYCRSRAKRDGHDMEITLEYLYNLWEEQEGICPFTGWDLKIREKSYTIIPEKASPNQASLDRIDPNKGYIPGNVQWTALIYNYAKHRFEPSDVIDFALAVCKQSENRQLEENELPIKKEPPAPNL